MRNSQKIDRLAQKLIDLSKVEGIVDESSLWQGLQGVKASHPKTLDSAAQNTEVQALSSACLADC